MRRRLAGLDGWHDLGCALMGEREAMGALGALLRARRDVKAQGGRAGMTALDDLDGEMRRAAAAALERRLAAEAPPAAQEVEVAPEGLRDRYEEALCALLGQEIEGAPSPWGDNASGYAWAQARLWWGTPRWVARQPRPGWTAEAALVLEGEPVAVARALAAPCEGETDRYARAEVWVRVEGGWARAEATGAGVGWGAWAAGAVMRALQP
jgi:hypothetical protein